MRGMLANSVPSTRSLMACDARHAMQRIVHIAPGRVNIMHNAVKVSSFGTDRYIYIYIYTHTHIDSILYCLHVSIYVYIYIYREREIEIDNEYYIILYCMTLC